MMGLLFGLGVATVALIVLKKRRDTAAASGAADAYQKAVFELSQPAPTGITYTQAMSLASQLQKDGYFAQAATIKKLAAAKRTASGGTW